jgi:acyl-CoA thioesterase-1
MFALSTLFWHKVKPLPVILVLVTALTGCGRKEQPSTEPAKEQRPVVSESRPQDNRPVIVAFGDSLSEGHGLAPGQSYPDNLQVELDRNGYSYRVENAGVSGDTTSTGLTRLDGVIALHPEIVILELGANDGLRGIPIAASTVNLEQMIIALGQTGARVVLAGMTLPPNYGPVYIKSFEKMYATLAAKYKLPLIPFLLEGVAGTTQYMQQDGLHPNAAGAKRVAATVMQALKPLLKGQ